MQIFIAALTLVVAVHLSYGTECPVSQKDGSAYKCYFSNLAFNTWDNTRRTCKMFARRHGNLAVLNNPEKLRSVVSNSDYFLNGEVSLSFWIGLKYVHKYKQFVWLDGSPLKGYHNWATVEKGHVKPQSQGESCVAINLYTAIAKNASYDQGKWHIGDCSEMRASLCQTQIAQSHQQPRLSELVAFHPEKAVSFFDKQPKGHSCTHGTDIWRFHNKPILCQQFCLINRKCAGYIIPRHDQSVCILKSNKCKMTFKDEFNTFYRKNVMKVIEHKVG